MYFNVKLLVVLFCTLLAPILSGELPAQDCPDVCSCHYHRVHWVASCSHRGLTSVPTGLAQSTHLLELNGNALTEFNVEPQIKLRRILLANNKLTFLNKNNFKGLGFLIDVDVSGNKLHTIVSNTFEDSPGLISFEARRNKHYIGPVDDFPFLESRSLQILDLSDSSISIIGTNFFSKSPALRKINLSGNPISAILPGAFSNLQGLEELQLSKTQVTHLVHSDFGLDPPLQILNLNHNKLDAAKLKTFLSKMKHLEKLEISDTGLALDNAQVDIFSYCNWLHTVDVSFNDLSLWDATSALGNLKHLEHLDLTKCNLNDAFFRSDALVNVTRLRSLKLSHNALSGINMTNLLQPLPKLQTLSVRNCQLKSTSFLRQLPKVRETLRILDLSKNPLGNTEVNTAGSIFTRLESLNVSHCGLTTITKEAFSPAKNLISLAFSGNDVHIEDGALSELTKLERLEIEDCNLKGAPSRKKFPQVSKLSELYLSGNPLDVDTHAIVPGHLKSVHLVDVSRCNLRKISSASLHGAENLLKLIAKDNNLSSGIDTLPDLGVVAPKLELIDLRRSQVQQVNFEKFKGCKQLKAVYLEENKLRCDCGMMKLWRWATSNGIALHERRGSALLQCEGQDEPWPKPLESLICTK